MILSDEKFDYAFDLAKAGFSIRRISKTAGIARQTAQDIQQAYRLMQEDEYGVIMPKNKGGYWDHKKFKF